MVNSNDDDYYDEYGDINLVEQTNLLPFDACLRALLLVEAKCNTTSRPVIVDVYLNLWTPSNFLPNSCRRRLNFSHTTPRRRLNFCKTSPGARRFFESEKRRDPSRAFIPVTK